MKINTLKVTNFRCFEHLEVKWHPQFNAIVGANGSGKSALLSALRVGAGAFFTGIEDKEVKKTNIDPDDQRQIYYERNSETASFTSVVCSGEVDGKKLVWERAKGSGNGKSTRTSRKAANDIKLIAEEMQNKVVNDLPVTLPIISYYPTSRLFGERKYTGTSPYGSRIRGYYNSLEENSDWKFLKKWFVDLEFARFQDAVQSIPKMFYASDTAKQAVLSCLPEAESLYYNPDKQQMTVKFQNGLITPFDQLSDGAKNLLLLAADIALKCILLNPQKERDANKTPGIVMIDELDLHLHPKWQRVAANVLQKAFPKIQFFITTHSPQVLSQLPKECVFLLKDFEIINGIAFTEGRDSNSILEDVFGESKRPFSDQKELEKFYIFLEENDLANAEKMLKVLESKWGSMDSEIVRANLYFQDLLDEVHS